MAYIINFAANNYGNNLLIVIIISTIISKKLFLDSNSPRKPTLTNFSLHLPLFLSHRIINFDLTQMCISTQREKNLGTYPFTYIICMQVNQESLIIEKKSSLYAQDVASCNKQFRPSQMRHLILHMADLNINIRLIFLYVT